MIKKEFFLRTQFALLLYLIFFGPFLHAETPMQDLILEADHSKVVTVDATPNDPGQVELFTSYVIQGGKFAWKSNGGRYHRGTYFNQTVDTQTTLGIYKDIDIGIIQGFEHLLDKENNYNEVRDSIDLETGEASEDTTNGPTHGFGFYDLGITGHWRFYHAPEKHLEISYVPTIYVPTGRRSNLDHLGPSQGYTSYDNSVAVTKDIGRWTTTTNLGFNSPLAHLKRTNNYEGSLHTNLAVGYQVLQWLQPEIEAIYAHDFGRHGASANLVSMVLGVIMPVNDHLRFELGLQQDVFGSNKNQTTSGIFSVAFLT